MRIKICLAFALCVAQSASWAQSYIDWTLELATSYSQSEESIVVDGKSASFRTGGAGLKINADTASLGSLYIVAGGGYLPKQSASFAGVVLTGPADSLFYGVGYDYQFPISDRLSLVMAADYVSYDISGDLKGEAFAMPVVASIDSTVAMTDISLGVRYALSPSLSAVLGGGVKHWSLKAEADALIGDSLTASTSVDASNTDSQFYAGIEFTVSDVPVDVYYRRSTLNADNSVTLNGLEIHILLMEF